MWFIEILSKQEVSLVLSKIPVSRLGLTSALKCYFLFFLLTDVTNFISKLDFLSARKCLLQRFPNSLSSQHPYYQSSFFHGVPRPRETPSGSVY